MKTKIISYYCDVDAGDTYYSEHAKKFIENMENLKINYYVEHVNSLGSYRSNCLFKPKFILKCLNEFKNNLMWLDIDSYVHKSMPMFDDFKVDIIMSANSMDAFGNYIPKASPLIFNYNENVLNFLKLWINKCDFYQSNSKKFFDHEILLEVLDETKLDIGLVGIKFCAFSDTIFTEESGGPYITMGISSGKSKEQGLIDMGHDVNRIKAENIRKTYYTHNGIIK